MVEQRDLLKTKTAAISGTSIRQEQRGEDGKRHECRGAIILRYQRRTSEWTKRSSGSYQRLHRDRS